MFCLLFLSTDEVVRSENALVPWVHENRLRKPREHCGLFEVLTEYKENSQYNNNVMRRKFFFCFNSFRIESKGSQQPKMAKAHYLKPKKPWMEFRFIFFRRVASCLIFWENGVWFWQKNFHRKKINVHRISAAAP